VVDTRGLLDLHFFFLNWHQTLTGNFVLQGYFNDFFVIYVVKLLGVVLEDGGVRCNYLK